MKKYLLDSHALIWAMVDTKKLSTQVLEVLQNSDSLLFVSAVSFWEIAVKYGKGKLNLNNFQLQDMPNYCSRLGIKQIPLTPDEAISYSNFPFTDDHKDPFDRMLIYQSIKNGYTLISRDTKMKLYEKDGLQCIW